MMTNRDVIPVNSSASRRKFVMLIGENLLELHSQAVRVAQRSYLCPSVAPRFIHRHFSMLGQPVRSASSQRMSPGSILCADVTEPGPSSRRGDAPKAHSFFGGARCSLENWISQVKNGLSWPLFRTEARTQKSQHQFMHQSQWSKIPSEASLRRQVAGIVRRLLCGI